uniref:Uncharacterized protein n=1 Tax=Manihot esculenta TaxID=3983 RepID=A0A2C9UZB2_MANES
MKDFYLLLSLLPYPLIVFYPCSQSGCRLIAPHYLSHFGHCSCSHLCVAAALTCVLLCYSHFACIATAALTSSTSLYCSLFACIADVLASLASLYCPCFTCVVAALSVFIVVVLDLAVTFTLEGMELNVGHLSCCSWSPSFVVTMAICFACFSLNLHILIL